MEEMDERISAIIAKYLAGEASSEEETLLTEWIAESREHARSFARLRDIDQAAHPAFDPESIDTVAAHEKMAERIRRENRRRMRRIIVRRCERAAAVLFLPVLLLAAYFYAERPAVPASETWQTVTTPYRTYSQLDLPDGSKVWLNGGSTLRYPLAFRKGERTVELSGEAYFEVESDKANPFVVRTRDVSVTATGTAFNVDAFGSDNVTSVTMVSGVVDVATENASRRVLPGERISYDSSSGNYTVDRTDPDKWYAWRDGVIVFENDRLDYVFRRLGQLFNIEFTVCDDTVNRYVYHAVFTDETLSEILEMLKISAPIRYEIRQIDSPDPHAPRQHIRVYGK